MATRLIRITEKLHSEVKDKGKTTSQAMDNYVENLKQQANQAVTEDKLRRVVKDAVTEALEGMRG